MRAISAYFGAASVDGFGQVGAVAGLEGAEGASDAGVGMRGAGLVRLGKGAKVESVEHVVEADAGKAVVVDGVGVGGCDGGPGREVVGVDVTDEARVVEHHAGGPERSGLVARAAMSSWPMPPSRRVMSVIAVSH